MDQPRQIVSEEMKQMLLPLAFPGKPLLPPESEAKKCLGFHSEAPFFYDGLPSGADGVVILVVVVVQKQIGGDRGGSQTEKR